LFLLLCVINTVFGIRIINAIDIIGISIIRVIGDGKIIGII